MLLRITNRCNMGCKHCMLDHVSTVGDHITEEMFRKAVEFALRCGSMVMIISGGEPTMHPQLIEFLDMMRDEYSPRFFKKSFMQRLTVILASNGHFLHYPELHHKIRDRYEVKTNSFRLMVQVTNDERFYPRDIPHVQPSEGLMVIRKLATVGPCTNTRANNIEATVRAPGCFNFRSLARHRGFIGMMAVMELQLGRFCVPSINVDGTVRAGESDVCHKVGTVDSPLREIEHNILNMSCDNCKLTKNLTKEERAAIGLD